MILDRHVYNCKVGSVVSTLLNACTKVYKWFQNSNICCELLFEKTSALFYTCASDAFRTPSNIKLGLFTKIVSSLNKLNIFFQKAAP